MKKLFLLFLVILIFACSGNEEKIAEFDLKNQLNTRDSLFNFIVSNKNKFKEFPFITYESDSTDYYLYVSAYLDGNKLKFIHQQYSEANLLLEDYFVSDEEEDLIFVASYGYEPNSKQKQFERKIYFQKENPKPIKDTLIGNKLDLQEASEYYNNFYELLEALETRMSDDSKN